MLVDPNIKGFGRSFPSPEMWEKTRKELCALYPLTIDGLVKEIKEPPSLPGTKEN